MITEKYKVLLPSKSLYFGGEFDNLEIVKRQFKAK